MTTHIRAATAAAIVAMLLCALAPAAAQAVWLNTPAFDWGNTATEYAPAPTSSDWDVASVVGADGWSLWTDPTDTAKANSGAAVVVDGQTLDTPTQDFTCQGGRRLIRARSVFTATWIGGGTPPTQASVNSQETRAGSLISHARGPGFLSSAYATLTRPNPSWPWDPMINANSYDPQDLQQAPAWSFTQLFEMKAVNNGSVQVQKDGVNGGHTVFTSITGGANSSAQTHAWESDMWRVWL